MSQKPFDPKLKLAVWSQFSVAAVAVVLAVVMVVMGRPIVLVIATAAIGGVAALAGTLAFAQLRASRPNVEDKPSDESDQTR